MLRLLFNRRTALLGIILIGLRAAYIYQASQPLPSALSLDQQYKAQTQWANKNFQYNKFVATIQAEDCPLEGVREYEQGIDPVFTASDKANQALSSISPSTSDSEVRTIATTERIRIKLALESILAIEVPLCANKHHDLNVQYLQNLVSGFTSLEALNYALAEDYFEEADATASALNVEWLNVIDSVK